MSHDAPDFPKYDPRRSTVDLPSFFSLESIVMYTWALVSKERFMEDQRANSGGTWKTIA